MNNLKRILLILLIIAVSAVLISLSVIFYKKGETSDLYEIYPTLGGIGIIIGVVAIVLIIKTIIEVKDGFYYQRSRQNNQSFAENMVDLDPKYLENLTEKKTYQLSIGYTDGKEDKCINAMEKYGWALIRKNEYNLTLYFERVTESLEIEKMLLPIAIRLNNDDDRFLEERKKHIYVSMELAKRLYNQYPSKMDTIRYAGNLLASAMFTNDFPFKDIFQEAQEQVRTRIETKPIKTYDTYNRESYSTSNSYNSYDDSDLDYEFNAENDGEDNSTKYEDYSSSGSISHSEDNYNRNLYEKYNNKYAIYLEMNSFPNYHGYYIRDGWGDAYLTENIEEAAIYFSEIQAYNEAKRIAERYEQYDNYIIKRIDVEL